jgi:hypothetical protein
MIYSGVEQTQRVATGLQYLLTQNGKEKSTHIQGIQKRSSFNVWYIDNFLGYRSI